MRRPCRSSPGCCPAGPLVPTCNGRRADRRYGPRCRVQRPRCRRAGLADRRRGESNGHRAGVGGSSPTAGLANRRRGPRCRSSPGLLSSRSPLSIVAGWSPTAVVPASAGRVQRPALPIAAAVPAVDRRRACCPAGPRCRSSPGGVQRPSCRATWCRRAGLADRRRAAVQPAAVPTCRPCRSSPVESNGRRADRRRAAVQPGRCPAAVPTCNSRRVDRRRACCPASPAVDRRRVESNGRRAVPPVVCAISSLRESR